MDGQSSDHKVAIAMDVVVCGNVRSDDEGESDDSSFEWRNVELDPDDEDQLLQFFDDFGSVVKQKRFFSVEGKVKSRNFSSHLRLFAALIVFYKFYSPSFLEDEADTFGNSDGFVKRGTLFSLSAIRHKKRFPHAISFVKKLDQVHKFLSKKRFSAEKEEDFLCHYDAGTALEGLRARFRKYSVWWKDGHEFGANRGGIPYEWKKYMYVLKIPLVKKAYTV